MSLYEAPKSCGEPSCEICSNPLLLIREDEPIDFTFTPLTQLTLDIAKAEPTLPLVVAAKIAGSLLARGYCNPPF